MNDQPSLLDEIPTLPGAQIDFLAGYITGVAFGPASTKAQKERARRVAEDFARAIVALRTEVES